MRARLRSVEKNHRAVTVRSRFATPIICGALWLATILLSGVSIVVITAFWLAVGVAMHFMVRRDIGEGSPWAPFITSALRGNEADIYEVRASAFLTYEPIDDEGTRYAFQIERDRALFIDGEVFEPGARFPSCDFNIVHALGVDGETRAEWIEKRGPLTEPAGAVRGPLSSFPDHLDVFEARLSELVEQQEI